MTLPTSAQYVRGMALENATRYAASRGRFWEAHEIVELAEYFKDYIEQGPEEDEENN